MPAIFRFSLIVNLVCMFFLSCTLLPLRLGPVGGPGGNFFDEGRDGPTLPPGTELRVITAPISPDVCGLPKPSGLTHYLQNTWATSTNSPIYGTRHGGGLDGCYYPGDPFLVPRLPTILERGEFLIGIYGKAGEYVDNVSFITTNSGFTSFQEIERAAQDLNSGGNPFFLLAPPGFKIRQFIGRSGAVVDGIGVIIEEEPTLPKTGFPLYKLGASGGWGGNAFEDPPVSSATRVTRITVTGGCYVYNISFDYNDAPSTRHGGSGPILCPGIGGFIVRTQSIPLDSDEFIRGVQGQCGRFVDRIQFVTNKRIIGPFGGDGGNSFSLMAPDGYSVKRLFGRSGDFMDSIGIIVESNPIS